MTKRVAYHILVLVVFFVSPLISSCAGKEDISTIIQEADALCKEEPEEAMALIVNYNYGNHHNIRANAYFQHALSQEREGNHTLAILSLSGAADALNRYDNLPLKAEVYRNMGDIYYEKNLFSNSYEAYRRAITYFERAGMDLEAYTTKYYTGRAAFKLYRYDEAKELLASALDYSTQHNNRTLRNLALHQLCDIHLYTKEYTMLCSTVELFDEYDRTTGDLSHYYCLEAIAAALDNKIADAKEYLNLAKQQAKPNTNSIKYTEYYIYRCIGDNKRSIEQLEESIRTLEAMVVDTSKHPILNQEIDLLKQHIENINYKEKIEDKKSLIYYILLTIVILILMQLLVRYRKKTRREAQQYIDTINELQLIRNNTKELEPLTTAIDRLYNDRLRDINQLCETYYEHSDTPRQATKVFEQVRQTIVAIKSDEGRLRELEELVDRCRDGIMSKLREECDKLNERELKVVLYSYAGFSSRAICIFVDSNPVALSKMKYRIKSKIRESECKDAELLISALN